MKKKILAVDDERAVLELVKTRLEANGYDVVCAGSTKECVDIIKSEKIDLVILDIRMPELDGKSALVLIRTLTDGVSNKDTRLPIIVYTALKEKEVREWFEGAKVQAVISKDEDMEVLISKVRESLKDS